MQAATQGANQMPRKSFLTLIISLFVALPVLAFGASAIARAQGSLSNEVDADGTDHRYPVGTSFSYQGQLKDASGPVTGNCDFQLGLWDAITGGSQVGATLTKTNQAVSEGLFTVQLDFGANAFSGSARWLEIAVRCPAGGGQYATLSPRQPLAPAPYALYSANSDTLDGQHAAAFQQHYQNLVVVAKSGGDFTTITDALDSITTNRAANPFTIYVAPGVYTETVTMKPYVDIEGAGEQATKITYTGSFYADTATVVGANHAELRFLTVENTGGDSCAVAIFNYYATLHMTNIAVIATGGTDANYGVYIGYSSPVMTNMTITASGQATSNTGVYSSLASPSMTNLNVTASGGNYAYAIDNGSSSPVMINVTATAKDGAIYNKGINNYNASPIMTNVTAVGSGGTYTYGVENDASSSPVMNHVIATASGDGYTYGVDNENYSAPVMTDVSASGSEGTNNFGVYNSQSSPTMTEVIATASGETGTYNYGVYNYFLAAPVMTNVTASASGGTESHGVSNHSSTPTMTNVIATASGASYNASGVYNGSSNAMMTNVTASATNGTSVNIGVYNDSSLPRMMNVSAYAKGGINSYGVYNNASTVVMIAVTATASGGSNNYGVWNAASTATLLNCVLRASSGTNDGMHNIASSGTYIIKINNSQVSGGSSTIYQDSHFTTQVGASQLDGGGAFGGTYLCVASYNGSYIALDGTCH
jgi:hypothetical protein